MTDKFNKNYQYRPKRPLLIKDIVNGIKNGDKTILSRSITLLESKNFNERQLVYKALKDLAIVKSSSFRIGITGSPGVGKSTFIESIGQYLGTKGKKVAVLAIDPSSNKTGGSILGDKTRMENLSTMDNVFIRPSPSKGELGGVAEQSYETILLCEKAGYEIILVETVGVGQSETHVKELVDFFLLLMLAGAGDELQGIKRGIMELADGILITKADSGNEKNAQNACLSYQNAMRLFPENKNKWFPEVLTCSSLENKGIENTWNLMNKFRELYLSNGWLEKNRYKQNQFWFFEKLDQFIKDNFYSNKNIQNAVKKMQSKVTNGEIDPYNAALEIFKTV